MKKCICTPNNCEGESCDACAPHYEHDAIITEIMSLLDKLSEMCDKRPLHCVDVVELGA